MEESKREFENCYRSLALRIDFLDPLTSSDRYGYGFVFEQTGEGLVVSQPRISKRISAMLTLFWMSFLAIIVYAIAQSDTPPGLQAIFYMIALLLACAPAIGVLILNRHAIAVNPLVRVNREKGSITLCNEIEVPRAEFLFLSLVSLSMPGESQSSRDVSIQLQALYLEAGIPRRRLLGVNTFGDELQDLCGKLASDRIRVDWEEKLKRFSSEHHVCCWTAKWRADDKKLQCDGIQRLTSIS